MRQSLLFILVCDLESEEILFIPRYSILSLNPRRSLWLLHIPINNAVLCPWCWIASSWNLPIVALNYTNWFTCAYMLNRASFPPRPVISRLAGNMIYLKYFKFNKFTNPPILSSDCIKLTLELWLLPWFCYWHIKARKWELF